MSFSGTLWPAHPHPYPGECLSSWLVRIAHNNGLKVQTFCVNEFGHHRQIWNRDIDRLSPDFVLERLSQKTGTRLYHAKQTTLLPFKGRLFPALSETGILRWVLPLIIYHRKHKGFGMQYCPHCLDEDEEPYFRSYWRLGLFTFCPKHKVLMHDRCWNCGASVAFHRIELGKPQTYEIETLDECWQCGVRLSQAPTKPIDVWHKTMFNMWGRILGAISRLFVNSGPINYQRLALLHQVCKILCSVRFRNKIHPYICQKTSLPCIFLREVRHFEQLDVSERHYLLQLAWWLVGNTDKKLVEAINKGALCRNYLYRDSNELAVLHKG